MKNLKKVLAVLMAVAMLLALGLNAFAATSDPNLVVGPSTLYSTPISANSTVTLTVTTANAYWQRTGFDSLADAASGVTAQVTAGVGTVSVGTIGSTTENGFYVATIPVTGTSNAYGPSSIHVTKTDDSTAYIDLTTYVEAATVQGPATGVNIRIYDYENHTINENDSNLTVYAAADTNVNNNNNIFYGMSGCAQSYPTAADALANYAASNSYYLSASGGYINAYGHSVNSALVGYYDEITWEGHGWNYAIVRDAAIVDYGDIFSASVMPVESGDVVYWVFGTYDNMVTYVENELDE